MGVHPCLPASRPRLQLIGFSFDALQSSWTTVRLGSHGCLCDSGTPSEDFIFFRDEFWEAVRDNRIAKTDQARVLSN